MRGLNLDHLRMFAQVAELGSFSAAAERNGVTQPAVSLQVRQLERRYGLKLVERVGRRARPTAAGLELLTHIRAIDATLAQAEQAMTAHASQVSGRLRLGTGATACTYLLPPLLADLRRRFPALEVVASTGNTADMLRGLENNALDIGLVTMPAPGRMFQVEPLREDEFVAISRRTDRSRSRQRHAAGAGGAAASAVRAGARTRGWWMTGSRRPAWRLSR